MKVFISWSGARSKAVAELLDEWIQCVLQAVEPWMSAKDIDRGALWFNAISDQLKEVTAGIVCLTQENKDRPWILFEAGALARGISNQRVMTFLIDLQPTDIEDPLAQFNHTLPDESGLRSLIATINSRLGERRIAERTLQNVFETYWPQFEARFTALMKKYPVVATALPRTREDKLDEVLEHVRGMDRRLRTVESDIRPIRSRHTTLMTGEARKAHQEAEFSNALDMARNMLQNCPPHVVVEELSTAFGFTLSTANRVVSLVLDEDSWKKPETLPTPVAPKSVIK